jgi:hypothetical protein
MARAELKKMELRDFLAEDSLFSVRGYLLKQAAEQHENASAELALLYAREKFSWDGLDNDPSLWQLLEFFATRGYSHEYQQIQARDLKAVCYEVEPEDRLAFIREVLHPFALMGNESAQEILSVLDLRELHLSDVLDSENTRALALLAEWGNAQAWTALEQRAGRENYSLFFLLHLSHHGYSEADSILKKFNPMTLRDRIYRQSTGLGGFMEMDSQASWETLAGLVELDIWGHSEARKITRQMAQQSPDLDSRIKTIRQKDRIYEELQSLAGQLDRDFKTFLSNYTQLGLPSRQLLRRRVIESWNSLSIEERVAEFEQNHQNAEAFTSIPMAFVLRKAREFGFHSLGRKDPSAR